MKHRVSEFAIGLLFGIGLILSGMTDPGKVIGFLDLAGAWDPSLALVMGGAILVGIFAFALAKKRTTTFLGGALHLPGSRDIDKRLLLGSLLFGAGWGLAGFCPGPAIVSLGGGEPKAAVFVLAMLAGMAVFEWSERRAQAVKPHTKLKPTTRTPPAIRQISSLFSVTGQLTVSDVPAIAEQGFATLINNRPDGEGGSSQAPSSDIEQAALAAGLHYIHLPVIAGAITPAQALAMQEALTTAPAPVLAFCRSGARSAELYKLAEAAN
jgi:uncharacterized protein (TIGR01244 family)